MADPKVLTEAEREALQEAAQEFSKQVCALLVGSPFEAVLVITERGTAARIAGEAATNGSDADFDVGLGHVCFCDGEDDQRMVNCVRSPHPEKTYAAFQAAGWIVEEAAGAVRGPGGERFCQECATFTCPAKLAGGGRVTAVCRTCGASYQQEESNDVGLDSAPEATKH